MFSIAGAEAESIDNNSNDTTSDGVTSSEVSSGVNALAAITGDSRVTSVANLFTARELFIKAKSEGWTGTAAFYYGLSALEVAQAGMNLKTAKSSKGAGNYLSNDGLGSSGLSNNGSDQSGDRINSGNSNLEDQFAGLSNDPDIKSIYGSIPDLNKLKRDLAKKGVSVNEKTGEVTANGKSLSSADLAKAAEKFTKSDKYKKLQASLAKKRRAYLNRVARLRSGEGGGYKSAAKRKGSSKSKRPGFNFNFGKKGSRGIASVPGKVKMVNGDPLGASSDNVFHIVERAYQGLVSAEVLREKAPKLGK